MYRACLRSSPDGCRHALSSLRPTTQHIRWYSSEYQPRNSIWVSLIPKAIRERNSRPKQPKQPKPKTAPEAKAGDTDWSPQTFYIIALLIIGSNAMKLVSERQTAAAYSRNTKARIGILKDAIERVHRGEKVDLKRIFGTGNEQDEEEWEEAFREIEVAVGAKNQSQELDLPAEHVEKEEQTKTTAQTKVNDTRRQPEDEPEAPVRPRFF